ncbi:MAG: hypothetical protein LBS19_10350 [Clostridiales bacterium]|jgi:hypothetical protein|nr:hypothetical protein [Clostridiales bacterium]
MQIIHVDNEDYLEVKNYTPENPDAFRAFWRELNEKYPYCKTCDFVFNNLTAPEELLNEIGAEKMDSCLEMRIEPEDFRCTAPLDNISLVTPETSDSFAGLHDRTNPDMYWTSGRIIADLSRWRIFRRDGAYLLLSFNTDTEVYALEAEDIQTKAALLSVAARYAFNAGKDGVLWMVDDGKPDEIELAYRLGFKQTGTSASYRYIRKDR